jgi:organic radical activating enzyme
MNRIHNKFYQIYHFLFNKYEIIKFGKNKRLGKIKDILITTNCNFNCYFCKNQKLIDNINSEISIKNFKTILKWHKQQNLNQIVLTGGEPTVHNNFGKIINELKQYGMKARLSTNLIFSENILNKIKNDVFFEISIHYFKENCKNKNFEKNLRTLKKNYNNIVLRYIINKNNDFSILSFAKKNKIKTIDISIQIPFGNNKILKKDLLLELNITKIKLMNFIKKSIKLGIFPRIVIAIPLCVFSKTEIKYLSKNSELHGVCNIILPSVGGTVVHPDLSLSWCNADFFHLNRNINLLKFNNNEEILDFYKLKIHELCWNKFLFKECIKCEYNLNKMCHGGCLGYKLLIKKSNI